MQQFLAFWAMCAFLVPVVISIVNRLKVDVLPVRFPEWGTWLVALVVGEAGVLYMAYLMAIDGIPVPARGVVYGVGFVIGAAASGFIDYKKIPTSR